MTRSYEMTLEDLEEALSEILPSGFKIKVVKNRVVVHTNLTENSYGELVLVDEHLDEDDEDDDLEEGYLDEDSDQSED
jgi:hypothetical protein